jgi:hypothetical protein
MAVGDEARHNRGIGPADGLCNDGIHMLSGAAEEATMMPAQSGGGTTEMAR